MRFIFSSKQLHFTSGIVLSIFISFHLFNHLISIVGIDEHLQFMNALRLVYRSIIVEVILLTAVLFQVTSGITLFWKKRKKAKGIFEKLQLWSGLYLAFFLIVHVASVMSGRLFLNLDTNFYFAAAGLNSFPLNLYYIPYYTLAILSFFTHFAAVHRDKMNNYILGLSPRQQSNALIVVGVIIAVLIFYGFTNGFKKVEIPAPYEIMINPN